MATGPGLHAPREVRTLRFLGNMAMSPSGMALSYPLRRHPCAESRAFYSDTSSISLMRFWIVDLGIAAHMERRGIWEALPPLHLNLTSMYGHGSYARRLVFYLTSDGDTMTSRDHAT